MNLQRENLLLTEIRPSEYRFSYEPMDEITPSAEGLVYIDYTDQSEGNGIDEPIFHDSEINYLDFKQIQVWDNEGFQQITNTEKGVMFQKALNELILEELN